MQLSVQQTHELLSIIDTNQLTIIGKELGTEYLTDYDRQLLQLNGVDISQLYRPEYSSIQSSFHFGMLAASIGAMAKNITYPELKEYVKGGKYLPVSVRQQEAIASIKTQTFASLKTMGDNIFNDVNNILSDRTLATQKDFLAKELKEGLELRKTTAQIASDIATKTGDWNRNFKRIIETASHSAYEAGKAAEIERENPDTDPLVYKHVQDESACKHCIRLYLTGGVGSKPIIFPLSVLRANGSNVGRKVDEWKATIPATHPFCRCTLMQYNEAYLWDSNTKSFSIPDPAYLEKTKAARPLFKVTIGDKIHYL